MKIPIRCGGSGDHPCEELTAAAGRSLQSSQTETAAARTYNRWPKACHVSCHVMQRLKPPAVQHNGFHVQQRRVGDDAPASRNRKSALADSGGRTRPAKPSATRRRGRPARTQRCRLTGARQPTAVGHSGKVKMLNTLSVSLLKRLARREGSAAERQCQHWLCQPADRGTRKWSRPAHSIRVRPGPQRRPAPSPGTSVARRPGSRKRNRSCRTSSSHRRPGYSSHHSIVRR